ncbi:MAG TPA: class I SAM-dependent methyltransferase [Candidatus Paceibacterota bacterium]|nr:class I SAM-dependent methyltransferase [Candidatus Paceibacterota bacterium]HPT40080.1 class I SAM-dependent methyltransferase [Candidatus Paceibacterota bacterium]
MRQKRAEKLLSDVKADYNRIAGHFSKTRTYFWPDAKFLLDYIKEDDLVLDLGCGNGRAFREIKERGAQYIGVDFSEELIKEAKDIHSEADFRVANALQLPFADDYFDKIYCFAVLHHIPSKQLRQEFMEEAQRVLKPGGLLILTVWDLWSNSRAKKILFQNRLKKLFFASSLGWNDVFYLWKDANGKILVKRYVHMFKKGELLKLAKRSDLEIINSGRIKKIGNENGNIYLVAKKSR